MLRPHSRLPFIAGATTAWVLACGSQTGEADSAADRRTPLEQRSPARTVQTAASIRFALDVSSGAVDPVYVLVNGEDTQPGWIRVLRGGERIHLLERCEIPDCGRPPAVCGLAIPMIQRLGSAGSDLSIELVWNGTMSVVAGASECESRVAAPPGDYVARFCYAREAEHDAGADPTAPVAGSLGPQTCSDVPFTLDDPEVLLRVEG